MKVERRWRIVRVIMTTITMFAVWLLFTASFTPFSLIAGFLGALVVGLLTYDLFIAHYEPRLRSFLPNPLYLVIFLGVLVFFLYQSSWIMLRAVISGKANPRIVHFRTRLKSDLARMVLANAITLTPGTITLDLNDDHLTVHWFFSTTSHAKAAGEQVKGRMEKYLRRVWP